MVDSSSMVTKKGKYVPGQPAHRPSHPPSHLPSHPPSATTLILHEHTSRKGHVVVLTHDTVPNPAVLVHVHVHVHAHVHVHVATGGGKAGSKEEKKSPLHSTTSVKIKVGFITLTIALVSGARVCRLITAHARARSDPPMPPYMHPPA